MGVEEVAVVGVPCLRVCFQSFAGKIGNGGSFVWSGSGSFWEQRSAGSGRWTGCDVVGECDVRLDMGVEGRCAGMIVGWDEPLVGAAGEQTERWAGERSVGQGCAEP